MNIEKIKILVGAITSCDGLMVDGSNLLLTTYTVDSIREQEDNQILRFGWTGDNNLEYSVVITEGGLDKAVATGNEIHVDDLNGDPTVIQLFKFTPFQVPEIREVTKPKP